MTELRDKIESLTTTANLLPEGPAKVAMLEEAVELADSLEDVALAYSVRDELMTAATFSGRSDILLTAFAWCVAQYDRNPELFSQFELLWKYKWVTSHAGKFPEISRPQLEGLLQDMERRYREAGSSMFSVHLERRDLFVQFGEKEAAQVAHTEFRNCKRDWLSDCAACVSSSNCGYFTFMEQWGQAVKTAEPVLAGKLTCAVQPHNILGKILYPLFRLGRLEEAQTYHQQGYRLVRRDNHFLHLQALHLQYLSLIGELAKAKQLVERHLPAVMETVDPEHRFEFLAAARLWAARVTSRSSRKLKVQLPEGPPKPDENGKSDISELGEWFTQEATTIAKRFDSRNGTTSFQQKLDTLPELLRLAVE